jgi:hypothetical protein
MQHGVSTNLVRALQLLDRWQRTRAPGASPEMGREIAQAPGSARLKPAVWVSSDRR